MIGNQVLLEFEAGQRVAQPPLERGVVVDPFGSVESVSIDRVRSSKHPTVV